MERTDEACGAMSMAKATRSCIVREQIGAGYGVEDIAVMFRIPVASVRFEVEQLRACGQLAHMFPRKQKGPPVGSGP